jgi:hypothetical protein
VIVSAAVTGPGTATTAISATVTASVNEIFVTSGS